MRYGFIGLGNMATAIIGGMVRSGEFKNDTVSGFDISSSRKTELKNTFGISLFDSERELAENSDVVILAVKPQVISVVFERIAGCLKDRLVISIAAGKTLSFLENGLGTDTAIIRVMPNINALVAAATSSYTGNEAATDEHKKTAEKIFGTVGTVIELPEGLFSAFTAIGGSSPAFAYIYIDALAKAGVKHGMPRDMALKVAASTVFGSAKMVMESGLHPMELCDRVCSPAGTTIDGVLKLSECGFETAVHQAIDAVAEKDRSL